MVSKKKEYLSPLPSLITRACVCVCAFRQMSDEDDEEEEEEEEEHVRTRRKRVRGEYYEGDTWNGGPDEDGPHAWDADGEAGHGRRGHEVCVDVRGKTKPGSLHRPYRNKTVFIAPSISRRSHLGSKLINVFESLVLVAFVALLAWSTDFSSWILPIHFTVAIAWHVAMINYPSSLSTYTSPLVDAAVLSFQVYRWQSNYDSVQPVAKLTLLCLFTATSLVRATWLALKLSPCSIRY